MSICVSAVLVSICLSEHNLKDVDSQLQLTCLEIQSQKALTLSCQPPAGLESAADCHWCSLFTMFLEFYCSIALSYKSLNEFHCHAATHYFKSSTWF